MSHGERGRGAGRPPSIGPAQIVAAALELGLAGLTLRRLARRLGVSPQAFYRYFSDMESLLDAVVDELDKRIPLPPDRGEDWCVWAYAFAYAVRRLLDSAPGLADRAFLKTQPTLGVLSRYEMSIAIALRSGFDHATALWATRAVTEFVQAWVSREQRRVAGGKADGAANWRQVREAVVAHARTDLPVFAATLGKTARFGEEARFDYGLRCLLAGIGANRSRDGTVGINPRSRPRVRAKLRPRSS